MGRVRERFASGPPQGHDRRVVKAAADGVVREALDVIVQCFGIDAFDGARDARVPGPLAFGPRLVVGHLANAIVYEVETFTEMAKDPSPHQLFHGLGGIGGVETEGPAEQRAVHFVGLAGIAADADAEVAEEVASALGLGEARPLGAGLPHPSPDILARIAEDLGSAPEPQRPGPESGVADPAVADRHSGYQVGGTSPFGTRRAMPVYLERSITELPYLYINGGRRGYLVGMAPADLVRVLRPVLVDVAVMPGDRPHP